MIEELQELHLEELYLAIIAVNDQYPEETREYAERQLRKIEDKENE